MKALLDTHTFLWFTLDDSQLSLTAKRFIEKTGNQIFVSPASIWEIAIKIRLGKYTLAFPFEDFIEHQLNINSFHLLPILPSHIAPLARLDLHHKDPFDRLLGCQALVESIPIISGHKAFDRYGVSRLW